MAIDRPPEDLNVSREDSFSLTCTASSYPLPNITWLHNMSEVIEGDRITISQNSTDRLVTSILSISNAMTTDSGDYVCRVGAPPGTTFNDINSEAVLVLVQGK